MFKFSNIIKVICGGLYSFMDFVFASISAIMRYSKILEVVLYIYP
jgi:hypothetical protein